MSDIDYTWPVQDYVCFLSKPGPEVIKLFFTLNLTEHKILNAHKYKKYKEIRLYLGSVKPRMLLFLLINVKMKYVNSFDCFSISTFQKAFIIG